MTFEEQTIQNYLQHARKYCILKAVWVCLPGSKYPTYQLRFSLREEKEIADWLLAYAQSTYNGKFGFQVNTELTIGIKTAHQLNVVFEEIFEKVPL